MKKQSTNDRERRIRKLAATWIENGNHANYCGDPAFIYSSILRDAAEAIDALDDAKVPEKNWVRYGAYVSPERES